MMRWLLRTAGRELGHGVLWAALLLVVTSGAVGAAGKWREPHVTAALGPEATTIQEDAVLQKSSVTMLAPRGPVNIPILMYHKTPADFEAQMMHLKSRGYETVTMDTVALALQGGHLPPKPVVITFDDGYADQMGAYEILLRHGMKATYYIINAGELSRWCVGAGRRYGDPAQPAAGCGDSYMTWDQVRELDRSGIIEIAAHTVDHADLPSLPAEVQRAEMANSKAGLEQELGHEVRHLAYPYGAHNATTVQLAREAGFVTAVTTNPGTWQVPGHEFELLRGRDAYVLP